MDGKKPDGPRARQRGANPRRPGGPARQNREALETPAKAGPRPAPERPGAGPTEQFAGFESVPLEVWVRVGSAQCRLGALAALRPGEVLRLDRAVGEPFDLLSDDRLLAFVEPVADDEAMTLKVVELVEDADDGRD